MRHCYAVPQNKVTRFQDRIFVNSKCQDVQSVNWKVDYKMFSGVSCADMVKSSLPHVNKVKGVRNMTFDSPYDKYNSSRTCHSTNHNRSNEKGVHSLMKHSDVNSTINQTKCVKKFSAKVSKHDYCTPVKLFNRFNVLNTTQGSETQNFQHIEPASVHSTCVNKQGKQVIHNRGESVASCDSSNKGENRKISPSDCTRNNKLITGNCNKTKVVLVETEDKYDLELRFKPKHRQRITDSKTCNTFKKWDQQVEDKYGFIPLGELHVPEFNEKNTFHSDLTDLHHIVKNSGTFNFVKTQIQVKSQLNADVWDRYLKEYWDRQLCFLIRYGFPLDHKDNFPLQHELKNHSTANQYERDIEAYLKEEKQFGAICGPFQTCPLKNMHFSPFLTREKPGAPHRRVIVDLSFLEGLSVNAGVDSDKYLHTPFLLTLPTLDTITQKVKENGRGSLLYKIDLSRAFRHIKLDPKDYNLLGLHFSNQIYYDLCLPFGFKHGSAIFQRISDAIRYIMHTKGFKVTNYLDDIIGHSVCSQASKSFQTLHQLILDLGFEISQKKLVTPSTRVTCLGVEIDTVNFTVSITKDKVREVLDMCQIRQNKKTCTKRELQSLLGKLLYITKCVKSSRYFLNRMLELLRSAHKKDTILLNHGFHKDLKWFQQFVPNFNGTAFFVHQNVHHEIQLDACLQGLGARWGDQVYAVPIPLKHNNMGIVHLEMLNILVAIRIWGPYWQGKNIKIHCDNAAVVSVLTTGKTRETLLAAIARNILMETATYDICLRTVHISGKNNNIADSLSRFFLDDKFKYHVYELLPNPLWVHVPYTALEVNWEI